MKKSLALILAIIMVVGFVPNTGLFYNALAEEVALEEKLLAKYEFEEGFFYEGATVSDSSENGYDGIVSGGDLDSAEGVLSGAINFNGNGYVELPTTLLDKMKTLNSFSVNALVKKNAVRHQFLFSASEKHNQSEKVSLGLIDAFNYRFESNGELVGTGRRNGLDNDYVALTLTVDFDNTTILYIDGVRAGQGTITQTLEDVNAAVLGIGVSPYGDAHYMGYMDKFEIYSSALTEEEVKSISAPMVVTPVYTDVENNRSYRGESITARVGEEISFEKNASDKALYYNYTATEESALTLEVTYNESTAYDYIINATSEQNAALKIADNLTIEGECSFDEIVLPKTVEGFDESSVIWQCDSEFVNFEEGKAFFEKKDYTYTVTFTGEITYQNEACKKEFNVLVHAGDCTPNAGTRALDINDLGYEAIDNENLIDKALFDYTCNSFTGWTSGNENLGEDFSIAEGFNDCGAIKNSTATLSAGAGSINPYIPLPEHTGKETFILSFAVKYETKTTIDWSNVTLCDENKALTSYVAGIFDGTNYRGAIKASPDWTINRIAFTPKAEDKYIRPSIGWLANVSIDNISIVRAEELMLLVTERYIDNLTAYDEEKTVLGEGENRTILQYGESFVSPEVPEKINFNNETYILVSDNNGKTISSDTYEEIIDFRYIKEEDEFLHPGVLNTERDLERIAQKVKEGEEPYLSGYNELIKNPYAQIGGNRAVSVISRGGAGDNCALLYRDAHRAYLNAIRWKISGDTAHADCARDILNAWSKTLTTVTGNADRYLASGIYGYELVCAAELMRDYEGFEKERMQDMLINVFYKPLTERFLYSNEKGSGHNGAHIMNYWANWDLCNMAFATALGVFCDRRDIYEKAQEYYKFGAGNGSIFNAVPKLYEAEESQFNIPTGQWQEAGRDFAHTEMGVGLMAVVCEISWNQGDDLYGWANNRFMYGAEYVAQYEGGYTVPFTTYNWYTGQRGSWSTQSVISGRSGFRPVWEMIYNHYANRMGYSVPGIKMAADSVRPEMGAATHGSSFDQFGFGTLLYTRDKGDKTKAQLPEGNIKEGRYKILSRQSGKALSLNDEGYSCIDTIDENDLTQLWDVTEIGAGVYKIVNAATGECLSIEDSSYSQAALVNTKVYENKFSQQFAFLCFEEEYDPYYQGYYKIANVASGLSLDVKDAKTEDGTNVLQYTYNSGHHQQWELVWVDYYEEVKITLPENRENSRAYIGVYNSQGILIRAEIKPLNQSNEDEGATFLIQLNKAKGEYVRHFLWNDKMEPVK